VVQITTQEDAKLEAAELLYVLLSQEEISSTWCQ